MDNKLKIIIQKSFDDQLSEREKEMFLDAVKRNPEFRAELKTMNEMRQMLGGVKFAFAPFFAEKVLNKIDLYNEAGWSVSLMYAFKRIALPGLAAAMILLLVSLIGGGTVSLDSILGVEPLHAEYIADYLIYNY